MPIYEYICKDCGMRFETLRSMSQADAPIACQGCTSTHTERAKAVLVARKAGSGGETHSHSSSGGGCSGCSGGSCAGCRH